jgi:membrane fusion protein, macrolide-specific efflux system
MTVDGRGARSAWVWAAALVAGLATTGAYWHSGSAPETRFLTAAVTRGHIENTVLAAGVLQPFEFVDVGAQVSGQLKRLYVQLGDKVEKGQLLAEIDPVISASRVVEAEATLANLRAQWVAKKEHRELAHLQKARSDELLRQGATAASESEIADSNYKVARAELEALDAQIKEARAALETARATLSYTRISAPMAGEVVSITAREGQTLNANQTAPIILRIGEVRTMTVAAMVPEADVSRLKVGQDVYFTVLGQAERRWYGKLRQVLPSPEVISNVVFYNALFDVANPRDELKVQMTAQVFFVLERANNALCVPVAAVGVLPPGNGDQATVRVLQRSSRVELRAVKLGIRNLVTAQVLSGLREGETVVVGQVDDRDGSHNKATPVRKAILR